MEDNNKLAQIEGLVEQLKEFNKIKQPLITIDASTGETAIIRRYRSEVKELAESEESYIKEQIKSLVVGGFKY